MTRIAVMAATSALVTQEVTSSSSVYIESTIVSPSPVPSNELPIVAIEQAVGTQFVTVS